MKNQIRIIICLAVLLTVISSLFAMGVGKSSEESLEQEELNAYHSRKKYNTLSSPSEKASYATGMNLSLRTIDGNDVKSLATVYNIISHPETASYYSGYHKTRLSQYTPTNLIGAGNESLFNADYFIAGYAQTMEDKVRIKDLSGAKGIGYLSNTLYK